MNFRLNQKIFLKKGVTVDNILALNYFMNQNVEKAKQNIRNALKEGFEYDSVSHQYSDRFIVRMANKQSIYILKSLVEETHNHPNTNIFMGK